MFSVIYVKIFLVVSYYDRCQKKKLSNCLIEEENEFSLSSVFLYILHRNKLKNPYYNGRNISYSKPIQQL